LSVAGFEQAIALHRRGQLPDAERLYEEVLAAHPRHAGAAHALGLLHLQSGRPERAAERLALAVRLEPDNADLLRDHGMALLALGLHDEAIASLDAALALTPDDATAQYLRANALLRAGRPEEAVAGYGAAIARKPDYFEAIHNRANALREQGRLEEGLADYERAASLAPNHPLALHNLAFALQDAGRFDEALARYNRAIGLKPDFHEARKARASLHLLLGRWEKGLPEFEHRLPAGEAALDPRLRAIRAWSGESLAGRSVAVYGDGAFGDLLQFGRFLPRMAASGAKVTLLTPPAFRKLLADALPGIRVASDLDAPTDYRCEVMSLPFLLKATPETLPPPLALAPDAARIATWPQHLDRDAFNVGICWQGNPTRNIDRGRSIPLAAFEPLARLPGMKLVSLQKKHGLDQLEHLPPGMAVHTLGPDFDEGPDAFVDTAAVLASLDLVVTSDTALAHLAGTLGRPTWIALRRVPEWRWGVERDDSPWYPSVRLFRQRNEGEWAPVFAEIASALRAISPKGPAPA
jgi:tetratricopeptide (TPR) repeat protein